MENESHFNAYGDAVRNNENLTVVSGRYAIQEEAERNIIADVGEKLRILPTDDLLEVGCGVGNLLIPLSFQVNSACGIDHPNVISKLAERFQSTKINLIGDNFLNVDLDQKFDKILIYSVLVIMPSEEALFEFIDKACNLLKPDGRMLLGDLNCIGRKERFLSSDIGKRFSADWNSKRANDTSQEVGAKDAPCVEITDELIMKILLHLRKKGFHSYLQEQPGKLPFGNTREDIVVVGAEYTS